MRSPVLTFPVNVFLLPTLQHFTTVEEKGKTGAQRS
jgi:hypothetical protein